jgi:hypothetical protein
LHNIGRNAEAAHFFQVAMDIDPKNGITLFKFAYFMEKCHHYFEAEVRTLYEEYFTPTP